MEKYEPWYSRASRTQLMLYGALGAIALNVVFDPEEALLSANVLLDNKQWGSRQFYGVIGGLFGAGAVGAMVGAWFFWSLKKKR